ncbi:hypothetical protein [Aquibium sp. ELW1220]|jgi:hypothetical protein|uniref:hypothetical protein n=1 Tax=Aquibium sp. ELW1220 TaxID=2976766 RepID=UPI0025B230DB|nr:hypothetical protein [Aquibium sp. ELW1220]MDN2579334.1 hypothetical protein [Aquibium sp. ELW1220]
MASYPEFDSRQIQAALDAAREMHDVASLQRAGPETAVPDDGHIQIAGGCISVTVSGGKVCLNLPLGIGSVCLPVPAFVPNGTVAQACIHICTTFGIPTGVTLTVSVAGNMIVQKSFGKC